MHSLRKNKCTVLTLVMILCLTLGHHNAQAQTDNMTLPDGFGINQIQTSENLSSGVLNINLPIESFLVPVSISYSTTGIRVSERAGVVGLGWSLNAGGFIARQKRGPADDKASGYSGEDQRGGDVAVSTSNTTFHNQVDLHEKDGKWDTHPDIYFYQFGTQSGQFTLDENQNIIKLTPSNLKITPIYNSTTGYTGFTVKDEQGNSYVFGNGYQEKTKYYTWHENDSDWVLQTDYFSKWPLTQMMDYQSGDQIMFSYSNAPLYTEFHEMHYKNPTVSPTSGSSKTKTEYQNLLLDKIELNPVYPSTGSESKIEFNYISRTDVTSKKALDEIKFTIKGNQQVTYNMEYIYLGESTASRLMLAEVSKSSLNIPLYQFAYFGQSKNEYTLPDYDSDDQDHWGYYNDNPINSRFELDGAQLSPHLYRTQANSLKKIYHTAGGFEEFEFELNSYHNGTFEENVGGLRIKKIRKGDFDGNSYTYRSYDYTNDWGQISGELYAEPLYMVTMSATGIDYDQYREHSFERLQDHMGRHIVYENVSVSVLGGGRIKHTFYTFEDDDVFGTNDNQFLRVSEYDKGTPIGAQTTHPYYSTHPGPFGYKNFKGSSVGLLKRKETLDYAENPLTLEEYFYTPVLTGTTLTGMNASLFGSGAGTDWYNIDFYDLRLGYRRLDKTESTAYDLDDVNKKIKTVTEYTYLSTHYLPKTVKTFLSPEVAADTRETTTTYLFEDPGTLTGVETSNLLALVKTKTEKKGTETLGSQTTEYALNSSGKIVVDRTKSYTSNTLVGDQSIVYDDDTGKPISVIDNLSGSQSTQFWNVDGNQIIAEFANASPDDCAFTSFEGDEVGYWVMPAMSSSNEETGIIGQAYDLGTSYITKSLTADKEYMISYWYKNGSVALTGVNTNQLIYTRTLDGWTFEERMISRTTNGDVTLSGTVHIDHLSLYPRGAMMSSYTYHDMFGKTSETDSHNNSIFYEYDEAGRVKLIKDKNLDIISSKEYKVTQYLHASWPEADVNFGGETFEILVESNGPWQVTNSSWITVSPTSGEGVGNITATISNNPSTTSRTGNITIKEDNTPTTGVPDFVIDVDQGAAPENYIVVTPSIIEIEMDPTVVVGIASNQSWTATVTNNPGNRITIQGSNTGTGDGSITISAVNITGSPLSGVVTVAADDGSVNAIINVYF